VIGQYKELACIAGCVQLSRLFPWEGGIVHSPQNTVSNKKPNDILSKKVIIILTYHHHRSFNLVDLARSGQLNWYGEGM
jgi:hypothetical protein